MDAGDDFETKDKFGQTTLMEASQWGCIEVVKLLLDAGADLEAKDKNGRTTLIRASYHGSTETVKILLDAGADFEAKDKDGYTALMWASHFGHTEIVKLLLDIGADFEAKDSCCTALMRASCDDHIEVVKLLLDRGANIEAKDKFGQTALIWASQCGRVEVVKLLLDRGANFDAKGNDGETALLSASRHSHAKITKLLLDAGANLEAKDKDGRTALILASRRASYHHGSTETVKILLDAGANLEAKNNNGQDALWYAGTNLILRSLLGEEFDLIKGQMETRIVRNDNQNVHDSSTVKSTKKAVEKLVEKYKNDEPFHDIINEIESAGAKYKKKISVLNIISREKELEDIIRAVWTAARSNNDMTEIFITQLEECKEYCLTGKIARIVNTLVTFDNDAIITSEWIIKDEIYIKSAKLRDDLKEEEDKDMLITNIREMCKKDYVDTNLMIQEKVNTFLDEWLPFI